MYRQDGTGDMGMKIGQIHDMHTFRPMCQVFQPLTGAL